MRLKQSRSVEEYKTQLENLPNRLMGLLDHYKLNYFLSELKDEIRLLVRMFHPHNLLTSYSLAKIHEDNLAIIKKPTKWPSTQTIEPTLLKTPLRSANNNPLIP